jgi:hypothetical protein
MALINGPVYFEGGGTLVLSAVVAVACWLLLREARTLVAALPIARFSKVDFSYCYYVNCTLIYY